MDATELSKVEVFADLSSQNRATLADVMRTETHPRGTVLVEEGEIPTKLFAVLDGHVTVHREGHHIADLGPGELFGEIGVLALKPRNASVIATTPVTVAVAMGWDFRRLFDQFSQLRDGVEKVVGSRPEPA